MPVTLKPAEASVDAIAALLAPRDALAVAAWRRPTWEELMQACKRMNEVGLGEIRGPEDLNKLPVDIPARAVFLVDTKGKVIRWLVQRSWLERMGIMFHDHMVRYGDQPNEVRAGYVARLRDGQITVR